MENKKVWTVDEIKSNLLTSNIWLTRAILAIFKYQTISEQDSETTQLHNNVGFNGADAPILSSFAKQLLRNRTLSEKQIYIARKKMPKYSKQLTAIANNLKNG